MAGVAQAERGGSDDSSIVLMLSLKLILLAFFILLNAISEFEEARTREVIDSVNKAFYGQLEPIKAPALLNGSPGFLPEADALFNDVGSLFEALVPAMRSTSTARARAVHIDLPSGALFRIGTDTLRPERKPLIRSIAQVLLQRRVPNLAYTLEFLFGIPAGGATGAARAQEIRRASDLVRQAIDEGLAPEQLAIGVSPGRPGRIEVVLSVRDSTADPDASLSAGPEAPR